MQSSAGNPAARTADAREAVEHRLLPVPDEARTSTAGHQFWIWAGANLAPINWVLGALGIGLGLSLADTVVVLVLGNVVGMAVFGFFVLMGQRTGVSQMVLSRAAFGRRGAYLPAAIQGVIAIGWCAVNTWIILDLVMALFAKVGISGGTGVKIVVALFVMAAQVLIAAFGFRAIATFERWTVPVTLLVVLAMSVIAWTRTGVHWDWAGQHLTGGGRLSAMSTVMTAIGIGWGITWFAYASDYSRFVPREMPRGRLFWASVLGQFVPVVWLGVLGATLATVSQKVDPGELVVGAFGALAVPLILLVVHGPIATNILNMYSCALCAQTLDWNVDRRRLTYGVGVLATVFTIFLIYQQDFANTLDAWLAGMVTWVAPWAAVVLIHYWLFARERVDVDALFEPAGAGRLADVRWSAVVAFLAGAFATWAFSYGVPAFLQGPGARALGGVDLSWLAGAVVSALVYYVAGRRSAAVPGMVGETGVRHTA
ncbi:purine-cytosine permease family protein [Microbispora sp. ATCC PTA-5024]|uniref:purine-cytosine permease family protein n=1 Tax=Microbispora sp. ATCC PTA-5024 TaxID=316330 RepID=UPI0003DDAD17|nr:cytosine permease [Microbispora sp. ATCC PTA-5024]ETK30785.1 cytosine/purines uracil thiamine allantoin permease [Microbispora sp. ATCC PTA-5024]